MNTVSVKYKKNEQFPEILVNGEQISQYMTLATYIYDDAVKWAKVFFESMDDEIAEEYTVELVGHKFHNTIFNYARTASQYCSGINFTELSYVTSVRSKYNYIKDLNRKYCVIKDNAPDCIDITSSRNLNYDLSFLKDVTFNKGVSDIYLCGNDEPTDNISAKYIIKLSKTFYINGNRSQAVIGIMPQALPLLTDYLNTYALRLKIIQDFVASSARYKFDAETRAELGSFIDEKIHMIVEDIPAQLDCGEKVQLSCKVFPADLPAGSLRFVSDNQNVIQTDGDWLFAVGDGTATVRIYGPDNEVLFSKTLQSTKHNYVTNITVILNAISMKVGGSINFSTVLSPENAEDAKDVQISISDESVAVLTSRNTLYGVSVGRVCVTVSTRNVSKKFFVSVFPEVAGLVVPSESLDLMVNSIVTFGCSYYPANAIPVPSVVWNSTNPNVVTIEGSNGFDVTIRTHNPGRAIVTCYINGTEIGKDIYVTVS